jgi:hypothetical protein
VTKPATVSVHIMMDHDGKWIAFGRSDNNSIENKAVNLLLGAGFLAPGSAEYQIDLTVPMPAELADVG